MKEMPNDMSMDDHRKRIAKQREQKQRADRAEEVANWYFRLNGLLSIPAYVVHPDVVRVYPLTEADLIAVRFPYSREIIVDRLMVDDPRLTCLATVTQRLFLLVEVKTDLCKINGPWSRELDGNMQRVIRRLGFADEAEIPVIATAMYRDLRWENDVQVLQYVAVGRRVNTGVQRRYTKLVQITWAEIADFFFQRFKSFPEKLPSDGRSIHEQWPSFGRYYGTKSRNITSVDVSRGLVWRYIQEGATGKPRIQKPMGNNHQ